MTSVVDERHKKLCRYLLCPGYAIPECERFKLSPPIERMVEQWSDNTLSDDELRCAIASTESGARVFYEDGTSEPAPLPSQWVERWRPADGLTPEEFRLAATLTQTEHDCSSIVKTWKLMFTALKFWVLENAAETVRTMSFNINHEAFVVDWHVEEEVRYGLGHRQDVFGDKPCVCAQIVEQFTNGIQGTLDNEECTITGGATYEFLASQKKDSPRAFVM